MKKHVHIATILRELDFMVDIELEWQDDEDDDGVGDSASTGNSMTGSRGGRGRWVPVNIDIDLDSLYKAAKRCIHTDDSDIVEAADEYVDDSYTEDDE